MAMDVFITWSGNRGRHIASALREWLPDVIQGLKPWMSEEDIKRGSDWQANIRGVLDKVHVGIVCLTRESLSADWILFEAGALSKSQEQGFVCTYLYDLEPAQVRYPLAMFQHTKVTKDETLTLLKTINSLEANGGLVDEPRLERQFERAWPEFERKLESIPDEEHSEAPPERSTDDKLDEILNFVREIAQGRTMRLARPATASVQSYSTVGIMNEYHRKYPKLSIAELEAKVVEDSARTPISNLELSALADRLHTFMENEQENDQKPPPEISSAH